jgi:Icc protein
MKKGIIAFIFLIEIGSVSVQTDISFIFLPDLHLRPDSLVEMNFNRIAKQISALNADFIITGGDMIYTAKNTDEKRAGELFDYMDSKLNELGKPIYFTMGNHELVGILPESGIDESNPLWGKRMYEQRYGARYSACDISGWKFFFLDGVRILEKEKNYTQEVDSIQIDWIRAELIKTDHEVPIIISIHTPLINPRAMIDPDTYALTTNSQDVLGLFKDHNLKMVLQGHNHLYMNLFIRGIQFISGGSTSYNPDSSTDDDGFMLVRIKENRAEAEFITKE